MTTTITPRQPKAKRLSEKPVPPPIEMNEPETLLDEYTRRCLAIDERDILEGQSMYPPLTLKEIVAICKETRAEMYAEEQERKITPHR